MRGWSQRRSECRSENEIAVDWDESSGPKTEMDEAMVASERWTVRCAG